MDQLVYNYNNKFVRSSYLYLTTEFESMQLKCHLDARKQLIGAILG